MANAGYNRGVKYNRTPYNTRIIATTLINSDLLAIGDLQAKLHGSFILTGLWSGQTGQQSRLVLDQGLSAGFMLSSLVDPRMIVINILVIDLAGSSNWGLRLINTNFLASLHNAQSQLQPRLVRDQQASGIMESYGAGNYRLVRDQQAGSILESRGTTSGRLLRYLSSTAGLAGISRLTAEGSLFYIIRFNQPLQPGETVVIDAGSSIVTHNGLFALESFTGKPPILEPGASRLEYGDSEAVREVEVKIDYISQYK